VANGQRAHALDVQLPMKAVRGVFIDEALTSGAYAEHGNICYLCEVSLTELSWPGLIQ